MIISFREGCSGCWLAQLLICHYPILAKIRHDGHVIDFENIFFLQTEGIIDCSKKYNNQTIIVTHSTDYKLLHSLWPNYSIIQIRPVTKIFKAISLMFHKKYQNALTTPIDHIHCNIKEYYNFYTTDPMPPTEMGRILDFGKLDNVEYLEKELNLKLNDHQLKYLNDYWELQKSITSLDESKLTEYMSKQELLDMFPIEPTPFNLALYIFLYEKLNNLIEAQRIWSIEQISNHSTWSELTSLMEYQ